MKGMRDLGYVKGDNIDVVYRFADGRMELLPSLAEELIHFTPKVIVDMPGRPDESAFEGGTDVPLKLDHFRC
jgi:hypothetical protein